MKLSVIIVTFNADEVIERCLRSLETSLAGIPYEAVVVDNGSSDTTVGLVQTRFRNVRLFTSGVNQGFAAGLNRGLRESIGTFVLWLNPDAEIFDGGILTLLRYMEDHPEVGVVGPQILDPNGGIQLSCRSFPSYRTAVFNRYSLLSRWFGQNPFSEAYLMRSWDHRSIREVDWVSGACLLHRRSLIKTIGALDEQFFLFCEDVDFCLRAKESGWKVVYHPGMQVVHRIGRGGSHRLPFRVIVEHHRSMWRYYGKHFRRHLFKDAFVAGAIGVRCLWGVTLRWLRGSMRTANR